MAPPWLSDGVAKAIDKRRQELDTPTMSMDEVLARKIQGDSLIVIGGSVFNVASFLPDHPGGQHALLHKLGQDATTAFLRAHGPSAHQSLVNLFCADIVEPTSPRTALPAKREVREDAAAASAASFGRDGGYFRSKNLNIPSSSAVPWLGEQSQLAGVSTKPLVGLLLPLPSQVGGTTTLNSELAPLKSLVGPLGAHTPDSSPNPHGAHPSGGSATSCPFMM